jgi:hypothetical protein
MLRLTGTKYNLQSSDPFLGIISSNIAPDLRNWPDTQQRFSLLLWMYFQHMKKFLIHFERTLCICRHTVYRTHSSEAK